MHLADVHSTVSSRKGCFLLEALLDRGNKIVVGRGFLVWDTAVYIHVHYTASRDKHRPAEYERVVGTVLVDVGLRVRCKLPLSFPALSSYSQN